MRIVSKLSRLTLAVWLLATLLLLSSCAKPEEPAPGDVGMNGVSTADTDTDSADMATAQDANQPVRLSVNEVIRAAKAGDPDAEYALGYMYYYGKGIEQDKITGESWINKAAAAGQPQALKAQQLIAQAKREAAGSTHIQAQQRQPSLALQNHNQASASRSGVGQSASIPASANQAGNSVAQTSRSYNGMQSLHNLRSPGSVQAVSNATVSVNALKKASPKAYTIQLLGAHSQADIRRYMSDHNLGQRATTYRTMRNGQDWYVLVYGIYPSYSAAQNAIKSLPPVIRAQKPWVNKLSNVQASIDGQEVSN